MLQDRKSRDEKAVLNKAFLKHSKEEEVNCGDSRASRRWKGNLIDRKDRHC